MGETHGGESDRGDRLAPVIPLFGAAAAPAHPAVRGRRQASERPAADAPGSGAPAEDSTRDAGWHRSWIDDQPAPVEEPAGDDERVAAREAAEKVLLKKLRSKSLSERESRAVLTTLDLDAHEIEAVIAEFLRLGYIDDERLAEQLVHIATERKSQGRQSVAQTLAARGIPRDVVDVTLAGLPDDDAERALEFARQKARSMVSLDRDTALRRLHGQLARRGFGGPAAMAAARQALDEAGSRGSSVRFR